MEAFQPKEYCLPPICLHIPPQVVNCHPHRRQQGPKLCSQKAGQSDKIHAKDNKPISKDYYEPRILSDKDDLYTYLKMREDRETYPQRTADIVAIETGLEEYVKTYLIMSPTIYGLGTGLFNKTSIQLPTIIRTAIKKGHVDVVGEGTGVWDAVLIQDLVLLYELLLAKVLSGDDVPSGK